MFDVNIITMSETDSEIQFETLKVDNDYEIAVNHYPYIIRKKSNQRILKQCDNGKGYLYVTLNKKHYYIHRIVAEQWIKNDDPLHKTEIDHCDHDKCNNKLNNLRWITPTDNCKNRTSCNNIVYEYVDELSEEAFFVDMYNEHDFDDLLFDPKTNCFYIYTGVAYKELYYHKSKNGTLSIQVYDIDHVKASISLNKFKRYFNLV